MNYARFKLTSIILMFASALLAEEIIIDTVPPPK